MIYIIKLILFSYLLSLTDNFLNFGKMVDIVSNFYAKLYRKDDLKTWNLPPNMEEQLDLETYEYFFLVSNIEKSSEDKHVHFSIYPINENTVHLFQIHAQKIVPQLLTRALIIIKEAGFNIISSTGICTDATNCYFGVFTSIDCEFELEQVILELGYLEQVQDVKVFDFSSKGCSEFTPE